MTIEIFLVNAFIGNNSLGNSAGVCFPLQDITDIELQNLATKFNASETAFIFPQNDTFLIRWFTPLMEVDLCGHATLAAASWIFSKTDYQKSEIIFESKSGPIRCTKTIDGSIEMEFPEIPVQKATPEMGLLGALAIKNPVFIGKSEKYFLIEVENEETLLAISPNFKLMQDLDTFGVFVTAKSSRPEYDFVSRCFFPKEGIMEDPVTGSAHCSLGPYWREKLLKNSLTARQASRQGGEIKIVFKDSKLLLCG